MKSGVDSDYIQSGGPEKEAEVESKFSTAEANVVLVKSYQEENIARISCPLTEQPPLKLSENFFVCECCGKRRNS